MGRLQVRQAVTAAIQAAKIPYVGVVYPARPVIASEQSYYHAMNGEAIEASDNGSVCIMVINIAKDSRTRKAAVGRDAVNDAWVHPIIVELFFASTGTGELGGPQQGIGAQLDYDSIVDNLTDFVRANATMGTPGLVNSGVWSAGEFKAGVQHQQSAAFTLDDEGMTVCIWGNVRFEAWEWIAGDITQLS